MSVCVSICVNTRSLVEVMWSINKLPTLRCVHSTGITCFPVDRRATQRIDNHESMKIHMSFYTSVYIYIYIYIYIIL